MVEVSNSDEYWHSRLQELEGWSFGSGSEMADELLNLVLHGTKRATASLLKAYEMAGEPVPVPGELSYIQDSCGRARCVVRVTRVELTPMNQVDADYARKEGEGDLSLEHWYKEHLAYFTASCESLGVEFHESDTVVCEEFEVVHTFNDGQV